ncbi:MAG: prolipoprotein diacylglyceryl transferase [Ruminococcaceae bacterium]|nr:prolipoprotein diacylglyceryl transferase [Oscillospiraceae bacterium]
MIISKNVINIFGKELPLYGLFCTLGMAVAALVGMLICRKRKIPIFDLVSSAVYVFIGAMIGSKLLFLALNLKVIIENHIPFADVMRGGFVFYGGLIGGALGLLIYVKQFKLKLSDFLDVYAVCLPLGHAFGRVGCFFGGCCHGIPHDSPISVIYKTTAGNTPLNTPLLPIQLIEATVLFFFFIIMLTLLLKTNLRVLTTVYLFMYSIARFVLEFFRGDKARGGVLGISTSQIISLLIIILLAVYLTIQFRKKKHVAN